MSNIYSKPAIFFLSVCTSVHSNVKQNLKILAQQVYFKH